MSEIRYAKKTQENKVICEGIQSQAPLTISPVNIMATDHMLVINEENVIGKQLIENGGSQYDQSLNTTDDVAFNRILTPTIGSPAQEISVGAMLNFNGGGLLGLSSINVTGDDLSIGGNLSIPNIPTDNTNTQLLTVDNNGLIEKRTTLPNPFNQLLNISNSPTFNRITLSSSYDFEGEYFIENRAIVANTYTQLTNWSDYFIATGYNFNQTTGVLNIQSNGFYIITYRMSMANPSVPSYVGFTMQNQFNSPIVEDVRATSALLTPNTPHTGSHYVTICRALTAGEYRFYIKMELGNTVDINLHIVKPF